jgi:hypothetical protein
VASDASEADSGYVIWFGRKRSGNLVYESSSLGVSPASSENRKEA